MNTEGEKIETNVAHVAPGEGSKTRWVFGELVVCKITSHQTGGAYSLFEVTTQPGAGPPPHVQHREDEASYVLEGEYEFLIEGHTIIAETGSLIYVPKGNLHFHENVSDRPGKILVSQTPGGLYERFLERVGEPAPGKPHPPGTEGWADVVGIAAIAAEHGIEIPLASDQEVD